MEVDESGKGSSVLELLRETKFEDGIVFKNASPESAIAKIFTKVSKQNEARIPAYFLLGFGEDGAKSFPSHRKINLELTDGVDGFTALTYVLTQALWHWELVGGSLIIVPHMSSEDGSVFRE